MTKKTKEVTASQKSVRSTPEIELRILESDFQRTSEALKVKREQLGLQSEYAAKEERAAFLDAFTLGDDLDDERAVRAAALLLEWGFGENAGVGSDDDKANLARGIGGILSLVADGIAMDRRRISRVANELMSKAKELERADLNFLAVDLRER
jgi:hypothetical protein